MRTARIVALKGAADLAARAAAFVTFPVMASRAGAAGYGAYALVGTISSFLVPFASLGLGGAMVRFVGRHVPNRQAHVQFIAVARIVMLGAVSAGLLMAAFAVPISRALLDWPRAEEIIRWGGLLVATASSEQVLLEYLRARDNLRLYVGYQLAQTVTTIIAVLAVMLLLRDIVVLVAVLGIVKAIAVGVTFIAACRPHQDDSDAPLLDEGSMPSLGAMIRFGLPITVAGFGLWLINLSDRLVVGYFLPAADLGRYGATFMFASLITVVTAPLYLPAYPRLMTAVHTGGVRQQVAEIEIFHRYISLLTLPAAGFLCVTVGALATRTGGPGFEVSPAVVVMLVSALFLDQWNGLAHYVLLCHGRTLFLQNVWLGYGLLNLVVNLVAVPEYGLTGAAAVTLVTFVLLEAHMLWAARRFVPILDAYQLRTTAIAAAASFVSAAAALAVLNSLGDTLAGIGWAGATFGLVYGGIVIVVGEVRVGELRFW